MRSLYIDDERKVPEGFTHHAKTFQEAMLMIQFQDWDVISFDHDLGDEEEKNNGLTLLNELEELVFFKVRKKPKVLVHSANPAGRIPMGVCASNINYFE